MQVLHAIKALRAAGFSQTEISKLANIPQPRLSRWENGDIPASIEDGLRLCELAREFVDQASSNQAA